MVILPLQAVNTVGCTQNMFLNGQGSAGHGMEQQMAHYGHCPLLAMHVCSQWPCGSPFPEVTCASLDFPWKVRLPL
jgi:hypothetical protein